MTEQDYRVQVQALLDRAASLEFGEAKVMMLEEAVRLADAHGDVGVAYEVRDALIDAATFGGFPDRALVAFAWCRGQQQKDPRRFPAEPLMWKQKWVVGRMHDFPHITRKQIEAALDDVEQCFERVGAGKRPVFKLRYQTARNMGDEAKVEALRSKWLDAPRDFLTDCRACELDSELDSYLDQGEYEQALLKAQPLLDGSMGCAEVPHMTLGTLLYPLFKLRRLEQAREAHLRGYGMVKGNRDFLSTVGEHLEFLALTANVERGLQLLARHLGWALEHSSHRARFTFHLAAWVLLEQAVAQGRERAALTLPRTFPLHAADGTYEVRALRGWFAMQAEGIGARFDARNGTPRFHKMLERARGLGAQVVPFPVER